MRSIWYGVFGPFSTSPKLRDRIKEFAFDPNRLEKLNELRLKSKEQKLNANDDMVLKIKDELWDFFINTKDTLFDFNWSVYRSTTKLLKEEKISSDDYSSLFFKAYELSDLGKYDEAIVSYDKVLEIKPDYFDAWFNRGLSLSDLGKRDEAIASYDKVLEIKPDDHEAWSGRGSSFNDLGKRDEAIAS